MSYEPKTWETGEVITASDLNHIENAIVALYVTSTLVEGVNTLSATYNDILTAYNAGKIIVFALISEESTEFKFLSQFGHDSEGYFASFGEISSPLIYSSNDADTLLTEAGGSN